MKGICHETTVAHSPEQNGVAERMNRTLVESARAMLSHSGLPSSYWAEAVNTAAYVRNRLPVSVGKNTTPFEMWHGRKPKVSHMKVFGCIAYSHIPDANRRKLDKKTEKLRFVGYSNTKKGYRLYDEGKKRTVVRRDVVFNEKEFGVLKLEKRNSVGSEVEINVNSYDETVLDRPVRVKRSPVRYGYDEYADIMSENVRHSAYVANLEPVTIEEALSGPNKEDWKKALDDEITALQKRKTWDYVKLPEGRTTIGCRWVLKTKYKADGSVERYKARLVAKGYAQKYGIDYNETFSPVVRFSSIRTLLAFALQNSMYVHQMDVVTAFLNGELDEEIFMEQPEGYVVPG